MFIIHCPLIIQRHIHLVQHYQYVFIDASPLLSLAYRLCVIVGLLCAHGFISIQQDKGSGAPFIYFIVFQGFKAVCLKKRRYRFGTALI